MTFVSTVVPSLIDALVTTANANVTSAVDPGVVVYDGPGSSDDPGDYLMIGVEDPDSADHNRSATSQQDWANANYIARDEAGDVTCAALSWNGDGNQQLARNNAYNIVNALGNALRSNPSLGLSNVLWTSLGTQLDMTQLQTADGALCLLIFTVHFEARI